MYFAVYTLVTDVCPAWEKMSTATAEPAKEMKEQEVPWDKAADKNLCTKQPHYQFANLHRNAECIQFTYSFAFCIFRENWKRQTLKAAFLTKTLDKASNK